MRKALHPLPVDLAERAPAPRPCPGHPSPCPSAGNRTAAPWRTPADYEDAEDLALNLVRRRLCSTWTAPGRRLVARGKACGSGVAHQEEVVAP